jgi:hypothetical protein
VVSEFLIPLYAVLKTQLTEGVPQYVRMAHLACIGKFPAFLRALIADHAVGSRKVNGVAEVSLSRVVLAEKTFKCTSPNSYTANCLEQPL